VLYVIIALFCVNLLINCIYSSVGQLCLESFVLTTRKGLETGPEWEVQVAKVKIRSFFMLMFSDAMYTYILIF